MHTEEEATAWVNKIKDELLESLRNHPEVPGFMKEPGNRFEDVWCSGCWLKEKLREARATKKEVKEIGFAHGQRSFFGNTYKWAVSYLNEFESRGSVKDKPGIELADKINETHIEVVPTWR